MTVHFLSKDGKGASYDKIDGWKSCLIPAWVGIFDFDAMINRVFFPICTFDLACEELCFPPGKGIERRNESTKNTSVVILLEYWR